MIRASWCISAFIRWKSSSVEFCVPAARISTPSSRSALTIDQVFTPPVKRTARLPSSRARWGAIRARQRASSSATSASTRSRITRGAATLRRVQLHRDVAQRLRGVGHPVEGLLEVGDPPALLHLAREVGEALGADDDVQLRAVGPAQLLELRVAGDAGEDPDPEPLEEREHPPEIAGDVVLADQVHVVVGGGLRLGGADDVLEQDLAGEPVADVLVADEPRRVDRDDRDRHLLRRRPADRLDVVAGHRGDAGRVDEDRLRLRVARRQVDDGGVQLLLAAEDDVVLEHLGGEATAVELRARRAAPRLSQELPAHAIGPWTRWITSVIGISTTRAPS